MNAKRAVSLFVAAVSLWMLTPVPASAAPAKKAARAHTALPIVISALTGTIRIVTPSKEVIPVSAGEPIPFVPSGSRIRIVSGSAEIAVGGTRVFLKPNQEILVTVNANRGTATISATSSSEGSVEMQVGGTKVLLGRKGRVELATDDTGTATILSSTGAVQVVEAGDTNDPDQQDEDATGEPEDFEVQPEPEIQPLEEASPSIP